MCGKSMFQQCYANIIYPTNGPQLWPVVVGQMTINPPLMRREIGRPKKMRNKSNDEPRNPHVLQRNLATITCKKCGALGHNKRSCKGKRAADSAIPIGGNKKAKAATKAKEKTATKVKVKTATKAKGNKATEIGTSSQG